MLDDTKIKYVSSEERRRKSNTFIKDKGIACLETLPLLEDSTQVKLKSLDDICKRAVATLLAIQLACDIGENNDYEESKQLFTKLLDKYGVKDELLDKEKRLFEGTYTMQDAIDVAWSYEAYWSLLWALGMVDDISYPSDICDCEKAIKTVGDSKDYEEFVNKCHLRDIEEILDMLDLYYRYHWACVEKQVNPDTPIGKLNDEVVMERRRGLEWLVSKEKDWNNISLDT